MPTETQPPVPAPPLTETGYVVGNGLPGGLAITAFLAQEDSLELAWPKSIEVYDRMRRDSQVASVLRAVTLPVERTAWRVDGTGCRPEVTQLVADDLGLPIVGQEAGASFRRTRDRFSWVEHLRLALLMLPFGHMFFEQVYRYDAQGLVHLRKLGPRMPRTIATVNVAEDGGLVSIEQNSPFSGPSSSRTIPVKQLVAYVLDKEGANWLGTSLLRSAYKNWLLKDMLLRVQAQSGERNGMGVPVYTGAPGEQSLEAGQKIATSYRAGSNAGAAIPFGAQLALQGVTGTLPDLDKPIRYHDEQIARAVLAHFLNLGTQTGSWALGSTFADFFTLSLQALAMQIADTASRHIVEDLVDFNWGREEPAPRIVHDEIGSQQVATAQAIKMLVDAKVITPDSELEGAVRQQYGLPVPTVQPADESGSTVSPADAEAARAAVEAIQKVYLGVGVVVSDEEARELVRRAGANISGPLPTPDVPSAGE